MCLSYNFTICLILLFSCLVPEEIGFNSQTKRVSEKCRRAELLYSSVEYIAPSEYMVIFCINISIHLYVIVYKVRPPQPSIYYFLIDVSYNSIQTGILLYYALFLMVYCL